MIKMLRVLCVLGLVASLNVGCSNDSDSEPNVNVEKDVSENTDITDDVDVEVDANIEADVGAEGDVEVDIGAEGDVEVDIGAEGDVEVDIGAEGEVEVDADIDTDISEETDADGEVLVDCDADGMVEWASGEIGSSVANVKKHDFDVKAGDPFCAVLTNRANNDAWSLAIGNGSFGSEYCEGVTECKFFVRDGDEKVVVTISTEKIGHYELKVKYIPR